MLAMFNYIVETSEITHVWIINENGFQIEESINHVNIHADFWGSGAYDNPVRGYVYEKAGVVSCHHNDGIDKKTIKKIEKGLDKKGVVVCYYKGKVVEDLVEA